jgi:glycosyltransferase involved in cell wall biosynthesis
MAQVAIVIPVFNGAQTIGRTLESAISQAFDGEFEVIVVNDGSTGPTPRGA